MIRAGSSLVRLVSGRSSPLFNPHKALGFDALGPFFASGVSSFPSHPPLQFNPPCYAPIEHTYACKTAPLHV